MFKNTLSLSALILCAALVSAVSLSLAIAVDAPERELVNGEILTVSETQVELKDTTEQHHKYMLSADCEVMVDGKPADVAAVESGMNATLTVSAKACVKIDATSSQ